MKFCVVAGVLKITEAVDINDVHTVRRTLKTINAGASINLSGYGFFFVSASDIGNDAYLLFAVGYASASLQTIASRGNITVSKSSNDTSFTIKNNGSSSVSVVITRL